MPAVTVTVLGHTCQGGHGELQADVDPVDALQPVLRASAQPALH